MTDEAKLIKDFVNVEKSIGREVDTFEEILEEIGVPRLLVREPRCREDITAMASCISNAETEEGIKSCVTINLEDIDRKLGRVINGEVPTARKFYEKLKERAKSSLKEWGSFRL